MRHIEHFIVGGTGSGAGGRVGDVFDPNSGAVQAKVPLGGKAELELAVEAAKAAQPGWAATNPQRRARVMFEFKRLVEANIDELARVLSSEHGKVLPDARGDVQRGLDVIEFACGIPHALKGEYTQGAGPGIDVYSMRQPLGIGAGIFKVSAMDQVMRMPFKASTATSNFMIGVTAASGAVVYFARGDVKPLVAGPVVLGVLLGAVLGARLMVRLKTSTIRKFFIPLIIYTAIEMIYRGVRG